MRPDPGRAKQDRPRAENRWYACDITAGRDVTIGKVFDQADRRDPGRRRTWIALAGGDNYQLGLFQAAAAARGITAGHRDRPMPSMELCRHWWPAMPESPARAGFLRPQLAVRSA